MENSPLTLQHIGIAEWFRRLRLFVSQRIFIFFTQTLPFHRTSRAGVVPPGLNTLGNPTQWPRGPSTGPRGRSQEHCAALEEELGAVRQDNECLLPRPPASRREGGSSLDKRTQCDSGILGPAVIYASFFDFAYSPLFVLRCHIQEYGTRFPTPAKLMHICVHKCTCSI